MQIRRLSSQEPLYAAVQVRALEQRLASALPPHELMRRAGLALARLAMAVAPRARNAWIVCGPGNNGGDGLEAAIHLHRWGLRVQVSLLGASTNPQPHELPPDAQWALDRLHHCGLTSSEQAPPELLAEDLIVDALLGLGCNRAPQGRIAQAIRAINDSPAWVVAADLPSGLCADTGRSWQQLAVRADHTLSFLALKPGLFTAQGRDHSGQVWLSSLSDPRDESAISTNALTTAPPASGTGAATEAATETTTKAATEAPTQPVAWLLGPLWGAQHHRRFNRKHATHKGSFGDVLVVGGDFEMIGAAWLAASAALSSGAGRVWLCPLSEAGPPAPNLGRPEIMLRPEAWREAEFLGRCTVVAGCGGGDGILQVLQPLLRYAHRLVLDADALNALTHSDADHRGFHDALASRSPERTVITPHPLEAARLLGITTDAVQCDRLDAAHRLAHRWHSSVVLKGSGTVVVVPHSRSNAAHSSEELAPKFSTERFVNGSGSNSLSTPGSGDVLAGWLGGLWAQQAESAEGTACAVKAAVNLHGRAGEECDWSPLRANDLIDALMRLGSGRSVASSKPPDQDDPKAFDSSRRP
jgi:hydroxyethylthiazole kinase-like uncharacterized protein yjeF